MNHSETYDSIDIEAALTGSLAEVIAKLEELRTLYPDGTLDVGTRMEYGETYLKARLDFRRPKTAAEVEYEMWDEKSRLLASLKADAQAFERNGQPFPRAEEMEALRKELGFFAMAPGRGSLMIFDGEVLVSDMRRTMRRDGTVVLQMMGLGSPELDAMFEKTYAEYRA